MYDKMESGKIHSNYGLIVYPYIKRNFPLRKLEIPPTTMKKTKKEKCENCGEQKEDVKYTKKYGNGEFLCSECKGE